MKKFIIAMSIATLTVSAYAAPKTPADATAKDASKACAEKAACPSCTTAGGACATCKEKADAGKAACAAEKAAKDASCTGSVCPIKK
jgi:hypothetical protein